MKKLKGYIFSRPFLGERVPQHIQNIVLRDYSKKLNINFLLSATEYQTTKSSYILKEILEKIKNYDGLLFYSFLQLPENTKDRINLFNSVVKNKKEIHFAVENLIAKNKKDFANLEELFLLKLSTFNNKKNKFQNKIGKLKNYVTLNHKKTKRNYLHRMVNEKVFCMHVSKKYGKDYWDGDRKFGYGGYRYIKNYHKPLAEKLIKDYKLTNNSKILDIGCGKGFLLYEIKKILKNISITGIDISKYAQINAPKDIKKNIIIKDINKKLNFKKNQFDLTISINTLHNLKIDKIVQNLKTIEKISKSKFICVESYRNNKEQFNLQCWALTAETIIDTKSWKYLFEISSYSGDFEFIFF